MSADLRGLRCWYCGDSAENLDHAIPKSRRDLKKERKRVVLANGRNTLPCCKPCNSLKSALTPEEFRAEIKRCSAMNFYFNPRDMKLCRLAHKLKQWNLLFYGERGTLDCTVPPPSRSGKFRYQWKMKQKRNTGNEAVRIEECAKRGEFTEVQGGLMNGK